MIMIIFAYVSILGASGMPIISSRPAHVISKGALWWIPVCPLEGWIIVRTLALLLKQSDNGIAWQIHSTKGFSDTNDVATTVVEEECWVVFTINANVSARLSATVFSGEGSCNSSEAITIIAVEARNENA
ncbi:hypothetical protein DFS33DRAFT_1283635 [Desarmillaria ectypa]|nr:hypothetical protein DFS33DRAFT_1283635 [Desarmillaria ectypa]